MNVQKENYVLYKISFPDEVVAIANTLAKHGHRAYAVGGCVRDSVMGRIPSDWDMTTDATPDEMLEIFSDAGLRTIPTGLKHGTVTVIIDKKPFEITTFRIDGKYTDSRHPDSVTFSSEISEDLRRRDFTVNAMAADPLSSCGAIVDLFGGIDDIKNRIIRCVGDPIERFSEDALRILRAVRFSSQLGYEIEDKTLSAAARLSHKLADISAERKAIELKKTLLSDNADRGTDVLYEIGAMKYIHIGLHKPPIDLSTLPKNFSARLAALFEGESKPFISEMKLSSEITRDVCLLADRSFFSQCCRFFGDNMGANARYMIAKYKNNAEAAAILRQDNLLLTSIQITRAQGEFITEISELAVNGNILMSEGIEQKALGKVLSMLLLEVIKDPSLNRTDALISLAKNFCEKENR